MLKILLGSPVGLMSLMTILGTCVVVGYWLYFIFKKHED